MNSLTQLLLIVFNFLYGIITLIGIYLNYLFIRNESLLIKILVSLLFALDYSFFYLVIIYKINYGIFHLGYLVFFVFGMIFAFCVKKRVKKTKCILKIIDRLKKK